MKLEIRDNSLPTMQEYRLLVGMINKGVTTVLAHEAFRLSNGMKEGLIQQRPGGQRIRPISRATFILRGIRTKFKGETHSKALIDSGSMVDAIQSKRQSRYHYTAGVHRGARGKRGKRLADIAAIHEYGTRTYTVTVTEKMRRFSFILMKFGILRAPWRVGQQLKRRTEARPFLNPAYDEWENGAEDRFADGLASMFGMR